MFRPILNAGMLLIAGSLLYIAFSWAAEEIVDAMAPVAPTESTNIAYLELTITWVPLLIVAAVTIILLSGAAARRGSI